jgi:hypothetical protein
MCHLAPSSAAFPLKLLANALYNIYILKTTTRVRLLAHYLPQYHPIKQNDEWWGPGFTEWVTTAAARPLFKGHFQPRIPGELGFYDLRLAETRDAQARLAAEHGIEGFCYWHYWLGQGREMLERPFKQVLESGQPDFPFCLGWANHDWKGVFFGAQKKMLAKQEYPGETDHRQHFDSVLKAFRDPRYVRVNNRPLFLIYRPADIPDAKAFVALWRDLAKQAGLTGIYFVGEETSTESGTRERFGLDAISYTRHRHIEQIETSRNLFKRAARKILGVNLQLKVYDYKDAMRFFLKEGPLNPKEIPSIVPGWDTTARLGRDATILRGATPELFRQHVRDVFKRCQEAARPAEENIVFIKSWNEWAEGNYLEPDRKYGRAFLEALRDEIY